MIQRYPKRQNETLQAWDSADDLILEHVQVSGLNPQKVLIINDLFGALSLGLSRFNLTVYTDSYVSTQGIRINTTGQILPRRELKDLKGGYDLVLIKLPNQSSFFEDILAHLSGGLKPGTSVICAGMVKHIARSHFDLLQKYIGETHTSLAKKKARLIFSSFTRSAATSPYPKKIKMEGFDVPFVQYSNLFSREKLDIGTRFFLQHLPLEVSGTILDLGCANGIVGIRAKMLNPSAQVIFTDDSWMAVESARINVSNQGADLSSAEFHWTNAFENGPPESVDWVLCNPPFHQQHVVGDAIAWQMFVDSRAALRNQGHIRVVGNSLLGYGAKLKKIFGNSSIVASNHKFTIYEATKDTRGWREGPKRHEVAPF